MGIINIKAHNVCDNTAVGLNQKLCYQNLSQVKNKAAYFFMILLNMTIHYSYFVFIEAETISQFICTTF